MTKRYIAL